MKISVVMTTYNGEKYLDQQIRSILEQTLRPAELIVCDDRSDDGTTTILERYSKQGLLTYHVNETRLGLINNFKKAVSLASAGNYVALSDQDDQWLPRKLEDSAQLLQSFEDPALPCMVYSDPILVDENDNVLNPSFRNEIGHDRYGHTLETLLFGNFVTGCTILMNPALGHMFADTPDQIRYHDAWLSLLAFTFGKAASSKEPQVRYKRHNNNLSISAGAKPVNRYRSTFEQLIKAVNGKDDFLLSEFKIVSLFYNQYSRGMKLEVKKLFEDFLKLEHRSYLFKKLAYGRVARAFPKE